MTWGNLRPFGEPSWVRFLADNFPRPESPRPSGGGFFGSLACKSAVMLAFKRQREPRGKEPPMNVTTSKSAKVHYAIPGAPPFPACWQGGENSNTYVYTDRPVDCMFCVAAGAPVEPDPISEPAPKNEAPAAQPETSEIPTAPSAEAAPAPMTREDWLMEAVGIFREWFADNEAYEGDKPWDGKVQVSIGWTSKGRRSTVRGECWSKAVADGVNSIFIRPEVIDDPIEVLACLLHELIHAVDNCESGHNGAFRKMAAAFGYTAPFTSSDNRKDELNARLAEVADKLGPIPGRAIVRPVEMGGMAIDPSETPAEPITASHSPKTSAGKTQTTRMLKVACVADDCKCGGYVIRTTAKWLEVGMPFCPFGSQMERV